MPLRIHRLLRARSLVPQVARRRFAANVAPIQSSNAPPEVPAPESPYADGEELPNNATRVFVPLGTKINWPLSQIYSVDGHLTKSPPGLAMDKPIQEGSVTMFGNASMPLVFQSSEGEVPIKLPYFWLRDNCRCKNCINQDTMQRAFDTFSIPPDVKPAQVVTRMEGLEVTWANDGHVSLYPYKMLMKHGKSRELRAQAVVDSTTPMTFWGSEIAFHPPTVDYDEIMASDKGVATWTSKIREYGFCYVDGCPVDPKATQALLERIAFIRITHYGGFYDFTADLTMKDTAYTNLALPAHTDTTYFTDPAGLQMFHLLSHTDGSGGESLLVDGFAAAEILKEESIKDFRTLTTTPVPWHASGNTGITITPRKDMPVLTGSEQTGIQQVRWNNDDRATFKLYNERLQIRKWYEAARKWNDILKRQKSEYWAQLIPGRPLIFDNWRVLHGRAAFEGKRRICGGYINHDDYMSRWRNTNFTREEVLQQIL